MAHGQVLAGGVQQRVMRGIAGVKGGKGGYKAHLVGQGVAPLIAGDDPFHKSLGGFNVFGLCILVDAPEVL